MNWAEARARLGQEGSKRLDVILHRLCLQEREQILISPNTSSKQYFFAINGHEIAHRANLLRDCLPEAVDNILQEANSICRHNFRLLGYGNLQFDGAIDWHADLIHAKRSPLKPWYKIDYLDFDRVGDHKIIWELNRHQHMVILAKAWRLTGKRQYSDELIRHWYSWRDSNPYPFGINWASSLEVAFRSLSWLWMRELLQDCPNLPATFSVDLLKALQRHGKHIERYLSTYFSPNTHLIGEAVALFFLGLLCPELPSAERWTAESWKIVGQEATRQIQPDGCYFEQSLYYHVYALDFFLYARILASRNRCAIPEQFDDVLRKMLGVVDALSEVGPIEGFGDDDGGRVFNPRRNRVEHLTDPLALGSIIYGESYSGSNLTEESIWLFGDQAVDPLTRPRPAPQMQSRSFPAAGIYLINDLKPVAQQLMIDAGPQGTGRAGHGHADALSVRMSVKSRRILIDPGTYCYLSGEDDRNRFRGTSSHNTLQIDNLDQALPEGPFAWSSIPKVTADEWVSGESFTYFAGSHNGYMRLPQQVLHRRFIFHVNGGLWLIRDLAEGKGRHRLDISWHLAPDLNVEHHEVKGLVTAKPQTSGTNDAPFLAMFFDEGCVAKTSVLETFVSSAYGSKQSAPLVRTSMTAELPQDCATILLTQIPIAEFGTFGVVGAREAEGARGYCYQTSTSSEFVFFASGGGPWSCGSWQSDASLLYCKVSRRRFVRIIMVAGSFGEYRGERFVSTPSVARSFEWSDSVDSEQAASNLFTMKLDLADSLQ